MAPTAATTPAELAAFIATQTDALIQSLSSKLSELQPAGPPVTPDGTRIKGAKPRILSTLFCLATRILGEATPSPDAKAFQLFITTTRKELKALQPDWRGPFSFEGIIQQGVGLYLRDAPNLGELVRSKPDFVFADEVNKIHESDEWMPLFTLKAKIQILESLRILTRDPAHLPLAAAIRDFLASASASLSTMHPDVAVPPGE